MKKISNNQMLELHGGTKCIYHFISVGITTWMGPISWGINYFTGNYRSVGECWNNKHAE